MVFVPGSELFGDSESFACAGPIGLPSDAGRMVGRALTPALCSRPRLTKYFRSGRAHETATAMHDSVVLQTASHLGLT